MDIFRLCRVLAAASFIALPILAGAQEPAMPGAAVSTVVPHLIRYSGALPEGSESGAKADVIFALYKQQTGGEAIWSEQQTVTAGNAGKFTVLLGSMHDLQDALFANGDARWIGMTFAGQAEQPRTLLTASAYALKAGDSQTLAGHPLTDFALKPKGDATAQYVSQINTASGLLGGGTGPTVNLSLDTSYLAKIGNGAYAQINAANTFKGNQTISGNLNVTGTISGKGIGGSIVAGTGIDVTSSNGQTTISLDGGQTLNLGNAVYSQLAASNTFSGANNTFNGNINENNTVLQNGSTQTYLLYVTNGYTGSGGAIAANAAGNAVSGTATGGSNSSGVAGNSAAGYGVQGASSISGGAGVYAEMGSVSKTFALSKRRAALLADGGSAGVLGFYAAADNANAAIFQNNSNAPTLLVQNTNTMNPQNSQVAQFLGDNAGNVGCTVFGNGVFSCSNALVGYGNGTPSVKGYGSAAGGVGILGQFGAPSSVQATYYQGATGGLIADGGNAGNTGLYALADTGIAGVFTNSSSNNSTIAVTNESSQHAIYATNNSSDESTLHVYNYGSGYEAYIGSPNGACEIGDGEIDCTGDINSNQFITGENVPRVVRTTSVQASGAWIEDAGSADLVDGRAMVTLHPDFARIANSDIEYQVFLTPGADCAGLYVAHKKGASFEVHEMQHGHSSLRFDYRILAQRRGKEGQRFTDVTAVVEKRQAAEEKKNTNQGNLGQTANQ